MNLEELRQQIADTGQHPFMSEVIKSPWEPIIDVEGFNRDLKCKILQMISECDQPAKPRCLVVADTTGSGKTHLLAWTRQQLTTTSASAFVYVPPYQVGYDSFSGYLFNATVRSLLRSTEQRKVFKNSARRILVEEYDRLADDKKGRKILGIRQSLLDILYQRSFTIGNLQPQLQVERLQDALPRKGFMQGAFRIFRNRHPAPSEVMLDFDTFCAACFAALGDAEQQITAERWFYGEPLTPEQRYILGVHDSCSRPDKIKNGMWTLSRIMGQNLCLAFDQMETMFHSLENSKRMAELATIMTSLEVFYSIPNICLLFFWQQNEWHRMAQQIDMHMRRRMLEGYGLQLLDELTREHAAELIAARMEYHIWKKYPLPRPRDNPYFPFTEQDIDKLHQKSQRLVYQFIKNTNQRYKEIVFGHVPVSPPNPPSPPVIDCKKFLEERQKRNLTQTQVGKEIGYSGVSVHNAEAGRASNKIYKALADFYQLPMEHFYKDAPRDSNG